jgi:hypothetical protein
LVIDHNCWDCWFSDTINYISLQKIKSSSTYGGKNYIKDRWQQPFFFLNKLGSIVKGEGIFSVPKELDKYINILGMGGSLVKYFIWVLFAIGIVLAIFWFFNHNEVIFDISQFMIGLGILVNTISIFKDKWSKPILYLFIIVLSFILLFDVYRIGKLFLN